MPLVDAAPVMPTPEAQPADSGGRVDELLAEGQVHFDAGDHQAAIDAWSRIFLVDIDHKEAARRIETARKLKDEVSRQVDEVFHEATEHRAAGRLDEARAGLEKVLAMQPDHLAARDAMEKLDGGELYVDTPPTVAPPPAAEEAPVEEGLFDPTAAPAAPSEAALDDAPALDFGAPAKAAPKKKRSFGLIAAVVALLLGAGGFFLWQNKDRLFPNSAPPETVAGPPTEAPNRPAKDPLASARLLYEEGEVETAINFLASIDRADPNFEAAQKQAEEWRKEQEAPVEQPSDSGVEDDRSVERDGLIEQARKHYSAGEYLTAAKVFRAADRIESLDGAAADFYQDARRQLLPMRQQIELFRQKDYDRLLPTLWQMQDENPSNRDVTRLLIDSYFNIAVRDLRKGDVAAASNNLREAAALSGQDHEIERLLLFCQGYSGRPADPLYKIFVKQIESRR